MAKPISPYSAPMQVSVTAKAGATYLIVLGSDAAGVKGGRYVLNWRLVAP